MYEAGSRSNTTYISRDKAFNLNLKMVTLMENLATSNEKTIHLAFYEKQAKHAAHLLATEGN